MAIINFELTARVPWSMKLPALCLSVFLLISINLFGTCRSASLELMEENSDSVEDTALLIDSPPPIKDYQKKYLRDKIMPNRCGNGGCPLHFFYASTSMIIVLLNSIRENFIKHDTTNEDLEISIQAFTSIGLIVSAFLIARIWYSFFSTLVVGKARIGSFIGYVLASLIVLGSSGWTLYRELSGDHDMARTTIGWIVPFMAIVSAEFANGISHEQSFQALRDNLIEDDDSGFIEETEQFSATFDDYSTLLDSSMRLQSRLLASRLLSDTYTRHFSNKEMLQVIPSKLDHPCNPEIIPFIFNHFSLNDGDLQSHQMANALLSTRDRYIFLRRLAKDGRLIGDLAKSIGWLMFESHF